MDESKLAEGAVRGAITGTVDAVKGLFGKMKERVVMTKDELKQRINVLFIDDEPFEYIDRIKAAGWNVAQVFDITNLDDEQLRRAHIIFLDYVGVGKNLAPNDAGIGLLKTIKQTYPEKIVIFYSGHAGFSLGDEFDTADDWMPKNSDPYVFILKIEECARKVQFK